MINKLSQKTQRWRLPEARQKIRLFINYARNNGWVSASIQAYRQIFWNSGRQYFLLYRRWYERKNIYETVDSAVDIFQSPRLLIIGAFELPQCKKYRVLQKVELLSNTGVKCAIVPYQNISQSINQMQLATQVVLYRVPHGELVKAVMAEAQRLGIAVGYDIDDPIFDMEVYRKNPNLEYLAKAEKSALLDSAIRYLNTIKQVDFVVTSTLGMEAVLKKHYQGDIIHWPNVIDGETLSILQSLDDETTFEKNDDSKEQTVVTIGYMSGSRAHEKDFRIIEQPLYEIMAGHSEVRLIAAGYCRLPGRFAEFNQRITEFPFAGYQGYFSYLKKIDINIVPLVRDEFNECKSGIRFLEASMLYIPTVASAVGDFNHLIKHGKTGFLAQTGQEWTEAIEKLISQAELRKKIGTSARQFVVDTHTIHAILPAIKPQIDRLLSYKTQYRNVQSE